MAKMTFKRRGLNLTTPIFQKLHGLCEIRGGRKVLTFANHLEGLVIFMVVLSIH